MKTAILLAAGASSRTTHPKQLYLVGNRPLVRHQADSLLASGADRVIVVVGFHADRVKERLMGDLRIVVVRSPRPEEGMFSSLLAGIDAVSSRGRILIHPVDVPLPESEVLSVLWESPSAIAVPVYQGKKGHPVCMDSDLAITMPHSDCDRLDRWLEHYRTMIEFIEVEEACIVLNANTDAELIRYFGSEEP